MNDTALPKPDLSHRDASYHQAKAGAEARQTALAQGADPAGLDALMMMGDRVNIGGILLGPYSMAVQWALQRVDNPLVAEDKPGQVMEVQLKDIALATLCFSEPKKVFQLVKAGKLDELEEMAFDVSEKLTPEVLVRVNAYIAQQFGAVPASSGDDAAKEPAVGESKGQVAGGS